MVVSGTKVELATTVVNIGVLDAPATRAKFFLSQDEQLDGGDSYLDYRDVSALVVDESEALSASLRIPHGTADGSWYLLTVLDVRGDVEEQYETNNVIPTEVVVDAGGAVDAEYAFACPDYITTDSTLLDMSTIASLNALHFGWENSKDIEALACVVSHFNLVGLSEVETEVAVISLVDALEQMTSVSWSYLMSDRKVGNANGTEYYAFVWQDDSVEMTGSLGHFDDPNDVIKREPYGANFRMGAFDFTFAVFHQRCGTTLEDRRAEAIHFGDIYTFFQNANGDEQDVLIGGDFNLPGNDYSFTAVSEGLVTYSVDPQQPTSISGEGLRNPYDNIFFDDAMVTERVGQGVLDFTKLNHSTVRQTVTDHIPVWMAFDTTVDDD